MTLPSAANLSTSFKAGQQVVAITSIDTVNMKATGCNRRGRRVSIDLRYHVGAVHVMPMLYEQWIVAKQGMSWVLVSGLRTTPPTCSPSPSRDRCRSARPAPSRTVAPQRLLRSPSTLAVGADHDSLDSTRPGALPGGNPSTTPTWGDRSGRTAPTGTMRQAGRSDTADCTVDHRQHPNRDALGRIRRGELITVTPQPWLSRVAMPRPPGGQVRTRLATCV